MKADWEAVIASRKAARAQPKGWKLLGIYGAALKHFRLRMMLSGKKLVGKNCPPRPSEGWFWKEFWTHPIKLPTATATTLKANTGFSPVFVSFSLMPASLLLSRLVSYTNCLQLRLGFRLLWRNHTKTSPRQHPDLKELTVCWWGQMSIEISSIHETHLVMG